MNDDGPENEEHFSHTGTSDRHSLLAFFKETLLDLL